MKFIGIISYKQLIICYFGEILIDYLTLIYIFLIIYYSSVERCELCGKRLFLMWKNVSYVESCIM